MSLPLPLPLQMPLYVPLHFFVEMSHIVFFYEAFTNSSHEDLIRLNSSWYNFQLLLTTKIKYKIPDTFYIFYSLFFFFFSWPNCHTPSISILSKSINETFKYVFYIVPEKVKYLNLCHSWVTLKVWLHLRVNFTLRAKLNS